MKGSFHNHIRGLMAGAIMASIAYASSAHAEGVDEQGNVSGSTEQQVPPQSSSQESDQPPASPLEDIVVTATRREERLQRVPISVTAITGGTLAKTGIVETRNLTQVVPGFTGGRNVVVSLPSIRGVGSSGNSPGDESNVATYVDGVYQPDSYSSMRDMVEVERIEVLRGPQGTVFGRNATGGLINIITPDPSYTTKAKISGRYGRMRNDANDYDARGYFTTGLSDTAAIDIAALYRKNDGYIKDLVRGGYLGKTSAINLRSKLLVEPSEALKLVLTGNFVNQDSSLNAVQPFKNNTAARRFPGAILPDGPWQASLETVPAVNYRRRDLSLKGQLDLGWSTVESTTAYLRNRVFQTTDSDASNFLLQNVALHVNIDTASQELRLLSQGSGRFVWSAGIYGFYMKASSPDITILAASSPTATVARTVLSPAAKTWSLAAFGEGTYQVTDRLFVTLGGRFTTEDRKFKTSVNGTPLAFGTAGKEFDKFTYRAVARYEFSQRGNVYASYGTGFKSGVFNAVGTSPTATNPEVIKAAEIGLKVDPRPWLRTNMAIYQYDYTGLQVLSRDPNGALIFILQNAANAKIYGGELEVTISPSRMFTLTASTAYNHGRYSDFRNAQVAIPRSDGGNTIIAQDVSGKQLIRTPKMTYSLTAASQIPLASGTLGMTANIFYSDRVYYDVANLFSQKPYAIARAEASWTTLDGKWRFSLWATNLTNAKVAQQIRINTFDTDIVYEPPRRIGVGIDLFF